MNKFDRLAVFFFILSATIVFSGCHSGSSRWFGYGDADQAVQEGPADTSIPVSRIPADRKIMYEAHYSIETKKAEEAIQKISEIAKKYNGYVLYSSMDSVWIKVAASSFKESVSEIEKVGLVKFKDIKGTDVTNEFYDLKTRIDSATAARERYLELLKKAENVEAALKVEKELERINTEIELLKGKQKRLDNQIDYASIYITLMPEDEKPMLGPVGFVMWVLFKSVQYLFIIK